MKNAWNLFFQFCVWRPFFFLRPALQQWSSGLHSCMKLAPFRSPMRRTASARCRTAVNFYCVMLLVDKASLTTRQQVSRVGHQFCVSCHQQLLLDVEGLPSCPSIIRFVACRVVLAPDPSETSSSSRMATPIRLTTRAHSARGAASTMSHACPKRISF